MQNAAARLMLSLAMTVRPQSLLSLPPLPDVLQNPYAVLRSTSPDTQIMMYKMLTAACILPWYNTKSQVIISDRERYIYIYIYIWFVLAMVVLICTFMVDIVTAMGRKRCCICSADAEFTGGVHH